MASRLQPRPMGSSKGGLQLGGPPDRAAAIPPTMERVRLLRGRWTEQLTRPQWAVEAMRRSMDRSFLAPNFSFTTLAHILRAARWKAISLKKSMDPPKALKLI